MENYNLVKVVGKGTYGKALLCERKVDLRKCIIKQIATLKLSRRELIATEQESMLLSKLQHPNIVAFWESFRTTDNLCIVMEYADAGDLDQYLKTLKKRYLPESEVLRIFIQISLALKYIHDRKILHRDLKSQVV
jgi:NIMA (never in mitosis gene a)-related kinase